MSEAIVEAVETQTKAMKPPKTLAEAIVAIQAEAPKIALDSTNPHFKSKYPSLAGIMEKILPVTSKHGLAVIQMPTTIPVWGNGEQAPAEQAPGLKTQLIYAATGEKVESTMLLLPAKRDPQGQGSALTYARRYMVLSMLGLVGDEDDDANKASEADGGGADSLSTKSPAAAVGFVSAKQKGFFQRLLKQGGLNSNQVEAVTRYAETLEASRIKKAIDQLKDNSDATVAALLRMSSDWASTLSDVPWDDEA